MVSHIKYNYQKELISLEAFLKEEIEYLELIKLGKFIPIDAWKSWKDPWGYILSFGGKISSFQDEQDFASVPIIGYFQSIEKAIENFNCFLSFNIDSNHFIYFKFNDFISLYENGFPIALTKHKHLLILFLIKNQKDSFYNSKRFGDLIVNNCFIGSKKYFEENFDKLKWRIDL